jgi:hypothetical protein
MAQGQPVTRTQRAQQRAAEEEQATRKQAPDRFDTSSRQESLFPAAQAEEIAPSQDQADTIAPSPNVESVAAPPADRSSLDVFDSRVPKTPPAETTVDFDPVAASTGLREAIGEAAASRLEQVTSAGVPDDAVDRNADPMQTVRAGREAIVSRVEAASPQLDEAGSLDGFAHNKVPEAPDETVESRLPGGDPFAGVADSGAPAANPYDPRPGSLSDAQEQASGRLPGATSKDAPSFDGQGVGPNPYDTASMEEGVGNPFGLTTSQQIEAFDYIVNVTGAATGAVGQAGALAYTTTRFVDEFTGAGDAVVETFGKLRDMGEEARDINARLEEAKLSEDDLSPRLRDFLEGQGETTGDAAPDDDANVGPRLRDFLANQSATVEAESLGDAGTDGDSDGSANSVLAENDPHDEDPERLDDPHNEGRYSQAEDADAPDPDAQPLGQHARSLLDSLVADTGAVKGDPKSGGTVDPNDEQTTGVDFGLGGRVPTKSDLAQPKPGESDSGGHSAVDGGRESTGLFGTGAIDMGPDHVTIETDGRWIDPSVPDLDATRDQELSTVVEVDPLELGLSVTEKLMSRYDDTGGEEDDLLDE